MPVMDKIKCMYCGKVYSSPSEAHKRSCRQHPKGCWKGCCKGQIHEEFLWGTLHQIEKRREDIRKIDQIQAEENAAKMAKRPVFFVDKRSIWNSDGEESLRKSNISMSEDDRKKMDVDLRTLSLKLINQWEEPVAKNTIEDLAICCQHAIDHEAGENEKLSSWGDHLKQLKQKLMGIRFWKGLFWLMEVERHGKVLKNLSNYSINQIVVAVLADWNVDNTGKNFNDIDDDRGQMSALCYSNKFALVASRKDVDPSWHKFLKEMESVTKEYDFWADIYCLLRLDIHP